MKKRTIMHKNLFFSIIISFCATCVCVHHTHLIFVAESYVYHGEAVYYEGYTFVRVYLCKDPLRTNFRTWLKTSATVPLPSIERKKE